MIRNFRGIAVMDWAPGSGLQALVGSGDSGKTTILEAVEMVLSPRWNVSVTDNDFFAADTTRELIIEATVGELPDSLKRERKFGLDLRGMNASGEIHDEPLADDQLILTVRFTVNSDLEPSWSIINDRLAEPKPIAARDRVEFGVSRLYDQTNQHFTWGRGSALLESMSTPEDVGRLLAEAQRKLRSAADEMEFSILDEAVKAARSVATEMGAGHVAEELVVSINADGVGARGTGISLHVGGIPLDRNGLGTRRLIALGLQRLAVREGAIMLVDEVESGLEPHRVRHLLDRFQEFVATPTELAASKRGQVLLTTHSAVVLEQLDAPQINVVRRSQDGFVTVQGATADLQAVLRANPEAFLAKKIVVCEGKTEIGLVKAMDRWWRGNDARRSMPHVGAAMADGAGSTTGDRATSFNTLGFPVAVLADSDQPLSPSATELDGVGIRILTWDGSMSTEQRVLEDATWEAFLEISGFAVSQYGLGPVRDAVQVKLGRAIAGEVSDWAIGDGEQREVQRAFGEAAKSSRNGWFKRIDSGEVLGTAISNHWSSFEYTPTGQVLVALHGWLCADDSS
jgi:hypothetical protein